MVRTVIFALLFTGATALLRSRTFLQIQNHVNFQEAKNVCLSIKEPCSGRLQTEVDDDSNKFVAQKLNLEPLPADFKGKIVPSALLITRGKQDKFDKHSTAFQKTEHEWSETMLPMFDTVADLSKKFAERTDKQLFSAVILPQAPSASKFMQQSLFDADVLDSLMETAGHKADTEKLFCEDIKKETKVCFNRLVHYRHKKDAEKKHITSKKAAMALREHHAVKEEDSKGRNAVLIVRKDHMGWMNFVEVEQKLRAKLEEKCWKLAIVEPTDAPAQQALEHLQKADLVVANHGPHNEHMIWMPRKAGFLEDKNCQCSTYGYQDLANQENLHYDTTFGPNIDIRECELQKRGLGICASDKPRVANFEEEIAPKLEDMIDLLEKDRSDIPSRCAQGEAIAL